MYRKGLASSNPVHPTLNNDDDIAEFRLADIVISPSCVEITQDLITDCRGSSECPWVTGLIEQVDTSTLFAQYQGWLNRVTAEGEVDLENQKEQFEAMFHEWLQTVQDEISIIVAPVGSETHQAFMALLNNTRCSSKLCVLL